MKMENYKTSDLSLAAFLLTLDVPLLGTKANGKRVVFHFPSTAAEVAPGYMQGVKVSARAFAAAERDLKSLIHSRFAGTNTMNMEIKRSEHNRRTPPRS